MTTGYLWTGQYPEAQSVIDEGKGQSMELDNKNLKGHWATNNNTGVEFFIINDAVFSKLCILGDGVEPCFEGASITDVENHFSKDSEFTATLFAMIKELNQTLYGKGGVTVKDQETQIEEENVDTQFVNNQFEEEVVEDQTDNTEDVQDDFTANEDNDNDDVQNEFADDDDDEDEDEEEEKTSDEDDTDSSNDRKKTKHSVEEPLISPEGLQAIQDELAELRAFKLSFENSQKDALIAKYHMLTDEDKADIVANKEKFTLEQIEEKLALVYVRKNVDFSTVDGIPEKEQEVEESPLMSFSLDNDINAEDADEDPILSVLRSVKW
jgi:hypothetical protein